MSVLPEWAPQDSRYMTWLEYHELTKHSAESLRRTKHYLDWANMPNPLRHYEGVPVVDLPANPPAPQISALEVLEGKTGNTLARDGAEFLSQLMFYSASISASKRVSSTGAIYSLRVNPSSGNLHPTEFHFCTRGLVDWSDGLYHYRPSSHTAGLINDRLRRTDKVMKRRYGLTYDLPTKAFLKRWTSARTLLSDIRKRT